MHNVNWLAILVSAVVFFLFGWLWYDVLFKNAFMVAMGVTHAQLQAQGMTAYPLIVSLVMSFFLAYGIARVLSWRGEISPGRGAFIGFSLGILIFGTMTYMNSVFVMEPAMLVAINIGYVAIGMAIEGAILGAWPPKAA